MGSSEIGTRLRTRPELLAIYPDFPDHAKQELEMFFFLERAHVEHVLEGLRKAGLTLTEGAGSE
jgi:hypothetical protein